MSMRFFWMRWWLQEGRRVETWYYNDSTRIAYAKFPARVAMTLGSVWIARSEEVLGAFSGSHSCRVQTMLNNSFEPPPFTHSCFNSVAGVLTDTNSLVSVQETCSTDQATSRPFGGCSAGCVSLPTCSLPALLWT